jgi:hypothetical protein
MNIRECKSAHAPANHEAIGGLMDGGGEFAGVMVRNEQQIDILLSQIRFLRDVLAEIHELTDPRATTPHINTQMVRLKSTVALSAIAKSGLLS